jgi:putative ABC transport system permease protein
MVLAESCLVAVLGGALGLAVAWLITSGGDPTGGMLPQFFFPHSAFFIGLAFSLALGLLAGIFPALAAMRLRVGDALRRM